ncbi:MAG: ACP S-malonyltransferase [Clostridium sp.]|nr:ACP S-malonyltransferase [Clostridium sp.]
MNKLGVVYSGQGSQYVGMGKELYENFEIAKEIYEKANEILKFDLAKMSFYDEKQEINLTQNLQPVTLTYSVALYEVFKKEFGIKPRIFAGHSLGEYSALTCSGAIKFEDALRLVRSRGLLMEKNCIEGGMIAVVGIDKDIIENYCFKNNNENSIISVSNYNSKNQTILSGNLSEIEKATEYFEQKNATVKRLNVSGAFHSILMKDAAMEFKNELDKYEFTFPKSKVISNVDALLYSSVKDIKEKLVKQLVSPVRWVDIMNYFYRDDINLVVEFGPKKSIRNFFKNTFNDIEAFSFENEEDSDKVREILKNVDNEKDYLRYFIDKCIATISCTKNKNPNEQEFQNGVIESCKNIRKIQENIASLQENDLSLCNKVLDLVKVALDTKRVDKLEQQRRLSEVISAVDTFELEKYISDYINNNFY